MSLPPYLIKTSCFSSAIACFLELSSPVAVANSSLLAPDASHLRPGSGYPGELAAYEASPALQRNLEQFNLTAGWFKRAPLPAEGYHVDPKRCPVNELPYLLFTPKRGRKPVPMVLYFGGTGEHGTNLVDQFRQTTVFAKVTAPAFQERHPCYVFAPMLPKGGVIRSALKGLSSNLADLVNDAMYAVIASLDSPPVDTNRLYLTGLSWGGAVAFELPCGHPGRFAASVPVSCRNPPGRRCLRCAKSPWSGERQCGMWGAECEMRDFFLTGNRSKVYGADVFIDSVFMS